MAPGARVVQRRVCSNSLRVVLVPMPGASTAAIAWCIRVGSRDDPPDRAGLTHFAEHMLYRGTDRHPDGAALQQHLESFGGVGSAHTRSEGTNIWLEVRPDRLRDAIEALGEMACTRVFAGVEVERRVVLDEIGLYYDEGAPFDLGSLGMRAIWPNHPLGGFVRGTDLTVNAMTVAELAAHFNRHFTAENSVVVVVGAFEPDEMFGRVERAFSGLPRGLPKRSPAPPPSMGRLLTFEGVSRSDACLGFTSAAPLETAPAALLAIILGSDSTGRLLRSLRQKAGLLYAAHTGIDEFSSTTLLGITLRIAAGKLPQAMHELVKHLSELRSKGPGDAELLAARQVMLTRCAIQWNDPARLAADLGAADLGESQTPTDLLPERLEAATAADVREVARRFFAPGRAVMVVRGAAEPGEYEGAWARLTKALAEPPL